MVERLVALDGNDKVRFNTNPEFPVSPAESPSASQRVFSSSRVLPVACWKHRAFYLPQASSAETAQFRIVSFDIVVVHHQEICSVQLVMFLHPFLVENELSSGHYLTCCGGVISGGGGVKDFSMLLIVMY